MVELLLLKQIDNLNDERVVDVWVQNLYYQACCRMEPFQWQLPYDPPELVHFHKCIGVGGVEKIFQVSAALHGEKTLEKGMGIDTTVQEKNIIFPTDTKLRVNVMSKYGNWPQKRVSLCVVAIVGN